MITAGVFATYIIAQTLASEPESLKVSLNQYACMIEAIHFEARGEDRVGKEAVANVILNRVESSRFPDDICAVVRQDSQFSYRDRPSTKMVVTNDIEKESFAITTKVAYDAVQGNLNDHTNGADHYVAPKLLKRLPNWMRSAKMTKQIGNHLFAKL